MPRDMGLARKKRQHPDGLQLSSSLPKRLLSISVSSSSDNASISPGTAINTLHGSLCNSPSSALINSDCSTSIHPTHSRISLDAASPKLEGPGFGHSLIPSSDVVSCMLEGPSFVLSRIPSDAASSKIEGAGRSVHSLRPCNTSSYNRGALNSTTESRVQGKGKGIWTYPSDSTKLEGLDCEGELSEVTSEKHARALCSSDGVSGSEKATHVISRRDVSSLNSKDEPWYKAAYGHGEYVSRGKQWESSSMLYGTRQRSDNTISSMACESASSCATADSPMEEIRPKQAFPHIYRSVHKESSTTPSHSHTRAEVLVGPRLQETIGCKDDNIIQSRPSSEVVLHPFTHKAATDECSPSYVLSSGRLSLEEEARLGRRAPTIDQDFEEYFSSLML